MSHLSWVEIDLDAIAANARAIGTRLAAGCELMAVVKANAYGHGLELVTERLYGEGTRWFGVNSFDEAVAVRELAPDARILVMGYVDPSHFADAARADFDLTLTNVDELGRVPAGLRVHLKVETGTHRRGLPRAAWADAVRTAGTAGVEIAGLSTHFANIEDTLNHEFAQAQLRVFDAATNEFSALGVAPPARHAACTAAAILFSETHFDLARVGIGLYGLWPSRETRLSARDAPLALLPALTWKTRITQITDIDAGESIGYGRTYTTPAPSRIAVLPVGYFEGYDRSLSGTAHVLVNGHRAAVRGRVCMNMCMVDVTHVPDARVGTEVVLVGAGEDARISAEDLAGWAGTIHYEMLSRIHPAIPRVAGSSPA